MFIDMHFLVIRPYTVLDTDERVNVMDPITFGMISIGVAGGSLIAVTVLDAYGFKVNETAIKIALEITKYGGMLYLLQHLTKLFL